MDDTTLQIKGMSCGHCVRAVREALEAVQGVEIVAVEVGKAVIKSAGSEQLQQARQAIAQEGYEVV